MDDNDTWEGEGGLIVIYCSFCNHWTSLSHDCASVVKPADTDALKASDR